MTEPLLPPIPEGLKVLRNAHGYNHYFTHLQMDKYGRDCANAAIEHYIAQQAAKEPLTDDQCDKVLQRIDEWATGYGAQEYGLPLFWMPNRARDVLREALGEKA